MVQSRPSWSLARRDAVKRIRLGDVAQPEGVMGVTGCVTSADHDVVQLAVLEYKRSQWRFSSLSPLTYNYHPRWLSPVQTSAR